jgi:hypothetical protein
MQTKYKKVLFIIFSLFTFLTHAQQGITKENKITVSSTGFVILKTLKSDTANKTDFNKKPLTANEEVNKNRQILKTNKNLTPVIPPINPQIINLENNNQQTAIYESPCVSYSGLTQNNSIPPDVSSAVGFDHIFLVLNDRFRISDKNGNTLLQGNEGGASGFWASIDSTDLFDPVITYDPYQNRWVFVICTDRQVASSAFLIAVSQGPDPLGGWFFYRFDADTDNNQWFDYPSVGFNKNWIVINGNIFPNPGQSIAQANRTWVLNKSQLYAGATVSGTIFERSDYMTICPSKVYDNIQNDLWCVTNDDVDDNDLRFFRVSGSPSSPSFTEEGFVSIGSGWSQGNVNIAPQNGSNQLIHAGDHRVLSVIYRNGKLYSGQTIFTPSGGSPNTATIQLVSSDPVNATVYESIRFTTSATSMYAFPCIAVNAGNDIIISCSKFTNTIFPAACVLVRRNGTGNWNESIFKNGEAAYINQTDGSNRLRWGDYTSAHVDPSDDQSVWLASEYARPQFINNTGQVFGQWGTWWAKICSGICDNDTYLNTLQTTGTMRKWEAGNTIYASSTLQSGTDIKLDAGVRIVLQPGFKATNGSRVRTYLEGCGGAQ